MQIKFAKYHGTGNDFILVDNRKQLFPQQVQIISILCARHTGIGADGLILLENSKNADFHMRYFNADGHEGSMCGNGGRCITAFAKQLCIIDQKAVFTGVDGDHKAEILSSQKNNAIVKLNLNPVQGIRTKGEIVILDTGSPHYIKFTKNIDQIDVFSEGRKIRYDKSFPEGINVNFVEILSDGNLKVRTYERGVENETLSCGTGVTAAAIASHFTAKTKSKQISIKTLGGLLHVEFDKNDRIYENIYLQGQAIKVFEGSYEC